MLAEHRCRSEERLGVGWECRHPRENNRGQLTRRGQVNVTGAAQTSDTDLVEQRPAVQRVAPGVCQQP